MKLFIDLAAGQKSAGGHQSNGIENGLEKLGENIDEVLEAHDEIDGVIIYGLFGKTASTGSFGFFDDAKKLPKPAPLEFSRALRCESFRLDGLVDFVDKLLAKNMTVSIVVGSPDKDAHLKRVEMQCRAKKDWNDWHNFVLESLAPILNANAGVIFEGVTTMGPLSASFSVYNLASRMFAGMIGCLGTVAGRADETREGVPFWLSENTTMTFKEWETKHSVNQVPANATSYSVLEGKEVDFYSPIVTVITDDPSKVERLHAANAIPCLTFEALQDTPTADGDKPTPEPETGAGSGKE